MFGTTLSVGIFIGACIVVALRGIQIVTRDVPKPVAPSFIGGDEEEINGNPI